MMMRLHWNGRWLGLIPKMVYAKEWKAMSHEQRMDHLDACDRVMGVCGWIILTAVAVAMLSVATILVWHRYA